MKRFSKIILILAGFCFLFGTAITVAAASLGGRIPEAVVFNGDWIDYFDHKYEGFSRREPVKITVNRLGSEEWSAEESGYLKKLNLSVGAAKIRIVEGEAEDSIYVKDATDYIQWEQNMDEDTLELNFYRDKRFRRHISTESAYAVLVIPKGYEFNEVEIQVGAGVLEAEIKQDSRNGGDTSAKEAELAETKNRAKEAEASGMKSLKEANRKVREEAGMGETDPETEKEEERAEQIEKDRTGEDKTSGEPGKYVDVRL